MNRGVLAAAVLVLFRTSYSLGRCTCIIKLPADGFVTAGNSDRGLSAKKIIATTAFV